MSWSLEELSGTHGVQNLLNKLEQSPLVRKQLPNTAAVLQQYFNYRRQGHENINAYLVRESLYYEEFLEALMALHGGHQGHAGFLDLEESSSSSESDGGHKDKKGYKSVPTEDPSSPVPRAHALMVHDLAVLELETLLVSRSPTPSSSLNYEDGGFSAVQLLAAKNGDPSWPQPRTSWTTTASGRPSRFCSTSRSCTGLQRLHRLHMDMALRTSSTWRKRTPGEMKIGGMTELPGRLLPGRRVPNGQKNLMEKFLWQRIQRLLILKP